jgi:hypothetical protein
MDLSSTLLQFLSGALAERLNLTPTELLSALNTLSAMPAHPYEQAKYELFGPGQTFPTFQEINVPENFNLLTARTELSCIVQHRQETVNSMVSGFAVGPFEGVESFNENEIVDREAAKRSIIFSEAIRTLTIKEIEADPDTVAKKVLSYYLKVNG